MGSPLSPVVANLFMGKLEEIARNTAPLKQTIWQRYVDDTFGLWKHGRKTLDSFLDHLNQQHPDIQFIMEVERNHHFAFLDVLEFREENRLDRRVYRKATHTDRYLHKFYKNILCMLRKQGYLANCYKKLRICTNFHLYFVFLYVHAQ